jgi:hypothetical protein
MLPFRSRSWTAAFERGKHDPLSHVHYPLFTKRPSIPFHVLKALVMFSFRQNCLLLNQPLTEPIVLAIYSLALSLSFVPVRAY